MVHYKVVTLPVERPLTVAHATNVYHGHHILVFPVFPSIAQQTVALRGHRALILARIEVLERHPVAHGRAGLITKRQILFVQGAGRYHLFFGGCGERA